MDIERAAIQAMFYDYSIDTVVENLIVRNRGGESLWYYGALKKTLHDSHASLNMGEVEAITNLIDVKWIGKAQPAHLITPLDGAFKVLLHCANIFLKETEDGLKTRHKHLLRWNSITRMTGEDWLVCIYKAYKQHGTIDSFAWPDILLSDGAIMNAINTKGLCDIHTHLGGAGDPFILNWAGLMTGGFLNDEALAPMGRMKVWSVMAARIRYALYSYYVEGNKKAFDQQMHDDLKRLAGQEKDFLTIRNWTHTLICNAMKTALETSEGQTVDYAIKKDCDDKEMNSPYMLYHGERRLLHLFLCDYQTGSNAVRKISRYVYLYALVKIAFRKQLIIDHAHRGLHYFMAYNHRKTLFIPQELNGVAKRFAYQTSIRPRTKDALELRVNAIQKDIEMVVKDECNLTIFGKGTWLEKEETAKANYVVHLSKTVLTHTNDANMRMTVDDLLENHLMQGGKITGIDAAGEELKCRPAQLGHYYRYLRERGHRNFTFHVGEDFYDIADGLKAIDEAIVFLDVRNGWRLGHCVALGIDPDVFYERKHQVIVMPRQMLLDNLIWITMTCKEERIKLSQELTREMANVIKGLMKELFGDEHPTMQTYYHAMWLRSDVDGSYNGQLAWERAMKCQHERSVKGRADGKAVMTAHQMRLDQNIIRRREETVCWKASKDYIRLVGRLQRVMIRHLEKLGVTIESNPTSNLMLGGLERYDELPLLRHSSTSWLLGMHLPFTINTDDKGLFGTSLQNEFALMAKAMSKKEGVLTQRKWSDKEIEKYLMKAVECSHEVKFRWTNNEYETHRI